MRKSTKPTYGEIRALIGTSAKSGCYDVKGVAVHVSASLGKTKTMYKDKSVMDEEKD